MAALIIILCAYVGYKITDVFSLYASDVMNYDQVNSAKVEHLLYIRPFVGSVWDCLADKAKTSLMGDSWVLSASHHRLSYCLPIGIESTMEGLFLRFY
jgi:hypothetical protein